MNATAKVNVDKNRGAKIFFNVDNQKSDSLQEYSIKNNVVTIFNYKYFLHKHFLSLELSSLLGDLTWFFNLCKARVQNVAILIWY